MRIYTKFRSFKSFKNSMRADKYLEKVKMAYPNLEFFIRTRKVNKDDGKKFQVGHIMRQGKKSNGRIV